MVCKMEFVKDCILIVLCVDDLCWPVAQAVSAATAYATAWNGNTPDIWAVSIQRLLGGGLYHLRGSTGGIINYRPCYRLNRFQHEKSISNSFFFKSNSILFHF